MITERDLQEAIAECEGVRDPDSRTCIKLAAFLIIRDHLYPEPDRDLLAPPAVPTYSYAAPPEPDLIQLDSGTEFAQAIRGRDPADVWPIMDELMDTLKVLHPRLYNGVLVQLAE